MKLRKQLLLIFVLMIIIAVVSYYGNRSLINSSQWGSHTFKVINEAKMVEKFMLDMETGVRGFIITDDETFLIPYNNAIDNLRKKTNFLTDRKVGGNPSISQKGADVHWFWGRCRFR